MIYGRLYARSLGIHIGPRHVRAVEMVRIGRWARLRRTWCLPVGDDPHVALAQLASKTRPATLRVASHLDPAHLKIDVRDVPTEELDRPAAAQHLASDLLPAGAPSDAFSATWRLFGARSDQATIGLATAASRAVEHRLAQLHGAGLDPSFIGVPAFEVANACAFDRAFSNSCKRLLIEHDGTRFVARIQDGAVRSLRRVPPLEERWAIGDAERDSAQAESVWLAPGDAAMPVGVPDHVRIVNPLGGLSGGNALEPGLSVAAGLAVRGLHLDAGRPRDGSFVEPAVFETLAARHEESLSKRLTFGLTAAVLASLLILTSVEHLHDSRLAAARQALAPLAGQLAAVEREHHLTDLLRSEVRTAEERLGVRTRSAAALASVAAASPPGVRWHVLEFAAPDAEPPVLVVRGIAHADTSLAVFLRELESASVTSDVRLSVAESITAGDGAGQNPAPVPALRRFEIRAAVPAAWAGLRTHPPEMRPAP